VYDREVSAGVALLLAQVLVVFIRQTLRGAHEQQGRCTMNPQIIVWAAPIALCFIDMFWWLRK